MNENERKIMRKLAAAAIADYTVNMESIVDPIYEYAATLER